MPTRTEKIREAAKRLLSEGKVDVVIGYRAGSIPLKNAPYFARTAEEADNLIWDSNCRINLANFLPRRKDKVAVVAKPLRRHRLSKTLCAKISNDNELVQLKYILLQFCKQVCARR